MFAPRIRPNIVHITHLHKIGGGILAVISSPKHNIYRHDMTHPTRSVVSCLFLYIRGYRLLGFIGNKLSNSKTQN